MGVEFTVRPVSARALEAARANPDVVYPLLASPIPESFLQMPAEGDESPAAIIQRSRVHDALRDQAKLAAVMESAGLSDGDRLDDILLYRMWDGLCEMLELAAPASNFFQRGGEELGEDLGYGPARFFGPGEVKAMSEAFRALDRSSVSALLQRVLSGPRQRPNPFSTEPLPIYATGGASDDDTVRTFVEGWDTLVAGLHRAAERDFAIAAWAN